MAIRCRTIAVPGNSSPAVWLASYPKSGNTWFRILVANLRSNRDEPVNINVHLGYDRHPLTRDSFDNVTMLDSGLLTAAEVFSLRPAVCEALAPEMLPHSWLKVHHAWTHTREGYPMLGKNTARAAVYIVRDPRDVAVSFSYHLGWTIDDTIELMNRVDATLGLTKREQLPYLPEKLDGWSGHVLGWLDQADIPVHLVTYEAMKQDTAAAFETALRFVDEPAGRAEIERAVALSDFKNLKRQEEQDGFRERPRGRATPFFRVGEAGGWRRVLTSAQENKIVAAHEPVMQRLGYL